MPLIKFNNIHLYGKGPQKALGELEFHCMDCIWNKKILTVREVRDCLSRSYKELSFNSVMTIMNRLVKKNLLKKNKKSGVYYYRPTISREDFSARVASDLISAAINDPVLFSTSGFSSLSESLDAETVSKLKKFIAGL